MQLIIAILLIAHGLIHLGLAVAPDPRGGEQALWGFFLAQGRSWLLARAGLGPAQIRAIAVILITFSTIVFAVAGFALVGAQPWWRPAAVLSACVSLALLFLFWHRMLWIGAAVNLGVLAALLIANWPPAGFPGG
jgi:hypothetical protein